MSVDKFETYAGFTSDHVPVTAQVTTYDNNGMALSLVGFTWNMLNQCTAHNNPFAVIESGANYVSRKVKQLEFLSEQMKSGTFDFIALQEVDIFTQVPLPEFVKNFLADTKKYGWLNTHSEAADNLKMPLLTFYNSQKLEFVSKIGVLPMNGSQKYCGLEATLRYANSNTPVCITNIHLDYNTNFAEEILKYQKRQIASNKFMIIAGDVNNSSFGYHTLIGDRVNRPSNINPKHELLLLDGVMASPAWPEQRVGIIEGPIMAFFEWVPANLLSKLIAPKDSDKPQGQFRVNITELGPHEHWPHVSHLSQPSEPWIAASHKHLLAMLPVEPKHTTSHHE